MNRILLLSGRPGVGKTTAIRRLADLLPGLRLAGFYTEEVRDERGQRTGFLARTFSGVERLIAAAGLPGSSRVGRYGVDIEAIDALADSELALQEDVDLYIIDEIGKMECLSQRFVRATRALLDSTKPVVATVGQRGGGFIAEARRYPGARRQEVTAANRDKLPEQAVRWLRERGRLEQRSG